MPALMFAPEPLAGSMLSPLEEAPAEGDSRVPEAPPSLAQAPDGLAEPPETPGALPSIVAPEASAEPLPSGGAQAELPPPSDPDIQTEPPPSGEAQAELPPPSGEDADTTVPGASPEAPFTASSTTIHVIVENVEFETGTVNVAVCDTALSREGCPFDTTVPAMPGFVEAKFEGVPPGRYAVVGYHDVNGNDVFDKFLGVPREPYALSRDAGEMLVPTFEDAALRINEGDNVVIIRLQRFGG
jgi:uncharacterized protein (DUF2141 family)